MHIYRLGINQCKNGNNFFLYRYSDYFDKKKKKKNSSEIYVNSFS